MDLNNGFFLGKDNEGFIVWNQKFIKRLISKDFKEAVVESKLIINNQNQVTWQELEASRKTRTKEDISSTKRSGKKEVKFQHHIELFSSH